MSRQQTKIERRAVHGVLLLDKPAGLSSNQALQKCKYLFRARKAGHTGSLDPLATGMLPVCFGEATKLSTYLLDSDKSYRTTARLGITTDSGDSDGNRLEQRVVPASLDTATVCSHLPKFRGEIEQVPPMYSALKHQGQRLYKLAREGKTVEREPRKVTIKRLELESLTPDTMTLSVDCTKGTYIRTLVEDLGEALGCGAHIEMLRRTGVTPYAGKPMLSLEALQELLASGGEAALDGCLLPMDSALEHLGEIRLDETQTVVFCHGNRVAFPRNIPQLPETGDLLRVYGSKAGQFLGLAELLDPAYAALPGIRDSGSADDFLLQPKKVLNL